MICTRTRKARAAKNRKFQTINPHFAVFTVSEDDAIDPEPNCESSIPLSATQTTMVSNEPSSSVPLINSPSDGYSAQRNTKIQKDVISNAPPAGNCGEPPSDYNAGARNSITSSGSMKSLISDRLGRSVSLAAPPPMFRKFKYVAKRAVVANRMALANLDTKGNCIATNDDPPLPTHRSMQDYLCINVGGVAFRFRRDSLAKHPYSRLGRLENYLRKNRAQIMIPTTLEPTPEHEEVALTTSSKGEEKLEEIDGINIENEDTSLSQTGTGASEQDLSQISGPPQTDDTSSALVPFNQHDSNNEPHSVESPPLYDFYDPESGEYCYDRSPYAFDNIANLYRCGNFHIPDNYCAEMFMDEMDYWMIDTGVLGDCCFYKLPTTMTEYAGDIASIDPNAAPDALDEDEVEPPCCPITREFVWEHMENPKSSKLAFVFNVVSILFVLTTMICLILSSMPQFNDDHPRRKMEREKQMEEYSQKMREQNSTFDDVQLGEEKKRKFPQINTDFSGLEIVDMVCVTFFTIEFLMRLWAAPDRIIYVKTFMFWIDFFAIFPFYLELAMKIFGYENKALVDIRKSLLMIRILRALRVMRVLRVLKVARFSKGFQSVGKTVQKSWKELTMLLLFIMTTNIMFSTVMYFLESDQENTDFESIPASAWWCIITMTTVGYGDVYPVTVPGKLVAAIVSIVGIILLAFPISVIVEHFHEEYTETTPGGDNKAPPAGGPSRAASVIRKPSTKTPPTRSKSVVDDTLMRRKLTALGVEPNTNRRATMMPLENGRGDTSAKGPAATNGNVGSSRQASMAALVNPNLLYRKTFLPLSAKQLANGVMVCELNPMLAQLTQGGAFDPKRPGTANVTDAMVKANLTRRGVKNLK